MADEPLVLDYPVDQSAGGQPRCDPWHLDAIGLSLARANGFSGTGFGVTVAVLDTGIDERHPDLAGKVVSAYEFDFSSSAERAVQQAPSQDVHGHGTHVGGLICSRRTGVAPDVQLTMQCRPWSRRAMKSGPVVA